MKTIFLAIIFTAISFGQLVVDSTGVEKVNDSEDWFWSKAHYEGTITLSNYEAGFFWGNGRDNLNFVPMGWFNHDTGNKVILFRSEMGNLPRKDLWVEGFIKPKSTKSKFAIGGQTVRRNGKDWYIDVMQEPYLEFNLPRKVTGDIDSTVTFSWLVTGENISYKWYKRTVSVDSTVKYSYDSLGVVLDSTYDYKFNWGNPQRISGQSGASYTTIPLKANFDGWKVLSVATGSVGDAITSRQTILFIRNGKFDYLK